MSYTEDFATIMSSARERAMIRDILNAWDASGLPQTFDDDGVKFAFNRNSGNVFLVNSDYQCAMMNGGTLESFYSTPYSGLEGFIDELLDENQPEDIHADDAEYILDVARSEGATLPGVWATFAEGLQS